jgi:hypothetical protein
MSTPTTPATAAHTVPAPRVTGAAPPGHRLALVPPMRTGAPPVPCGMMLGTLR